MINVFVLGAGILVFAAMTCSFSLSFSLSYKRAYSKDDTWNKQFKLPSHCYQKFKSYISVCLRETLATYHGSFETKLEHCANVTINIVDNYTMTRL